MLFSFVVLCMSLLGGANNQSTVDLPTAEPIQILKSFFQAANRLEYDGRSTITIKNKNFIAGANMVSYRFAIFYHFLCIYVNVHIFEQHIIVINRIFHQLCLIFHLCIIYFSIYLFVYLFIYFFFFIHLSFIHKFIIFLSI